MCYVVATVSKSQIWVLKHVDDLMIFITRQNTVAYTNSYFKKADLLEDHIRYQLTPTSLLITTHLSKIKICISQMEGSRLDDEWRGTLKKDLFNLGCNKSIVKYWKSSTSPCVIRSTRLISLKSRKIRCDAIIKSDCMLKTFTF